MKKITTAPSSSSSTIFKKLQKVKVNMPYVLGVKIRLP